MNKYPEFFDEEKHIDNFVNTPFTMKHLFGLILPSYALLAVVCVWAMKANTTPAYDEAFLKITYHFDRDCAMHPDRLRTRLHPDLEPNVTGFDTDYSFDNFWYRDPARYIDFDEPYSRETGSMLSISNAIDLEFQTPTPSDVQRLCGGKTVQEQLELYVNFVRERCMNQVTPSYSYPDYMECPGSDAVVLKNLSHAHELPEIVRPVLDSAFLTKNEKTHIKAAIDRSLTHQKSICNKHPSNETHTFVYVVGLYGNLKGTYVNTPRNESDGSICVIGPSLKFPFHHKVKFDGGFVRLYFCQGPVFRETESFHNWYEQNFNKLIDELHIDTNVPANHPIQHPWW